MIRYRDDIDGLRAFAALLVVAFHCGFAKFVPGGFVGVDIFFVISGYLITGIVHGEVQAGRFSLWQFYERRVRRIFPALIAVYVAVLLASFVLLFPGETAQQAKNATASILFVSNVYFYLGTDYFDSASRFNALLHTWSISVEEQFYLFFPPLLALVHRRFRAALKPLIAILLLASLILSAWRVQHDASAAFYLVQYRAWELMIGAVLALGMVPAARQRWVAEAGAVVGVALIVGSVLLLDRDSLFPGLTAAPACIGAACLIWSGMAGRTLVGRGLGLPPARFVGRISYSLYLWHWPLWVLGGQVHEIKSIRGSAAFILSALLVAAISWRWIEQPFRGRNPATPPRQAVWIGVAAMLTTLTFVVAAPFAAGAYWQVPAQIERVADFVRYRAAPNSRAGLCFLTTHDDVSTFDRGQCLRLSPTKPNVLLLGDSHAAHFYRGLAALNGINVLQANASGCRPVADPMGEARCTALMRYVTDDFLPNHRVDTVILSALWRDDDWPALQRQIARVRRYADHVVVFGPIAEYDRALPRILADALYRRDPSIVDRHRIASRRTLDAMLAARVPATGATYVSTYRALCPNDRCTLWTDDGNPIQFDYGHLTARGSRLMIDRVRPQLPFAMR
ncbi:acyltransferase family protein [Sphingomonas sp. Leaf62]|uniref:acyltransferase family protein n=1 Tax=Sphingomonas sp. Leaf62 TaxID=1736228 RepID=UPI0006F6B9FA|nr:acyltransferase family protein [Sphingomonas sp. Leaf62]KQN77375.1 hypothetical protein ASE91_15420 [Sphingomonas sp. Leaf62]